MNEVVASLKRAADRAGVRTGSIFKINTLKHDLLKPTLFVDSRPEGFDLRRVDGRVHGDFSRKPGNGLSSVPEQQSVETGCQRDVSHRVRPVSVVHHLRLHFTSWKSECEQMSKTRLQSPSLKRNKWHWGLVSLRHWGNNSATKKRTISPDPTEAGVEDLSGAASRVSCPGPALEQSTFTTLISPT